MNDIKVGDRFTKCSLGRTPMVVTMVKGRFFWARECKMQWPLARHFDTMPIYIDSEPAYLSNEEKFSLSKNGMWLSCPQSNSSAYCDFSKVEYLPYAE